MDCYKAFSAFIEFLVRREKNDERMNSVMGVPSDDMRTVTHREIKSRLSVSSEDKMHKAVNIILAKDFICHSALDKELKNSIMGHQTDLRNSIPKSWTTSDLEELKFILFGSKEEE